MKKLYYRELYCSCCEQNHYIIYTKNIINKKDKYEAQIIINKKSNFLKIKNIFEIEKIQEKTKYSLSCDNITWMFNQPIITEEII